MAGREVPDAEWAMTWPFEAVTVLIELVLRDFFWRGGLFGRRRGLTGDVCDDIAGPCGGGAEVGETCLEVLC